MSEVERVIVGTLVIAAAILAANWVSRKLEAKGGA